MPEILLEETVPAQTVSPPELPSEPLSSPTFTQVAIDTPTSMNLINLEASNLRGTIIHFWHTWPGAAVDVVQSLVEDFNLHNEWGILVVPVRKATLDDMSANVNSSLGAEETPDLVIGYPHQYLEWNVDNGLVDLRPYVEDLLWGLSMEEQADFYPVIWEQDVLDGRRLGIPAQRSAQVLFYNETWARTLGFMAPPVTLNQFMEQACSAARASRQDDDPANDGKGGWIISTNYAAMLGWIYSFGGEVIKSPEPGIDQSVYQFNTPPVEETFTFLRGLADQFCAWLPQSPYSDENFASRLGLFATGSVMDIPYQLDYFRQVGNNDRWTVIPFPSPSLSPAVDIYGPSFVVLPSTPQRQLAAWLLIKWLIAPQNHARLIEETSGFPLRASELSHLATFQSRYPQWSAALEFLPLARTEPYFLSWATVRWALSDASTQLFRDYFSIEQVPSLIEYLDRTAADLHLGPERSGIFNTPTSPPKATVKPALTPSPSLTPTSTPILRPSLTSTITPTK